MAKTQTLAFPIRLPDTLQAEALRLLDASCTAINQAIMDLWPQLDLFATDRTGPAWKQVEKHLVARSGHGSRQERNEMEQAGRILRAQATRKQLFGLIFPLLTEGLIIQATERRPARKNHREIREGVQALRANLQAAGDDAESFMAMTNLLEQACNRFLARRAVPDHLRRPPAGPGALGGPAYLCRRRWQGQRPDVPRQHRTGHILRPPHAPRADPRCALAAVARSKRPGQVDMGDLVK